jgi:hypothetical protein
MLVRPDDSGTLLIGQPSHAWVSGQLARAWGSPVFGELDPYEEVCLAAEQHDIGMAEWDLAPTLNPDTGLPHSFIEMPLDVHMSLWRAAPRRLLRQSRYAALLTSMHGVRLYGLRDLARMPSAEAAAIREFCEAEKRWQDEIAASLGADPAEIARNSQLLWTWDYMSLAVCLGWPPCTVADVPTAGGSAALSMTPGARAGSVVVSPWPFRHDEPFSVRCEGQRLTGRFESQDAVDAAIADAPWEIVKIELSL